MYIFIYILILVPSIFLHFLFELSPLMLHILCQIFILGLTNLHVVWALHIKRIEIETERKQFITFRLKKTNYKFGVQ